MKSKKFTSIAAITALGVLLPITQGHAFGLGKIELSSALNQPFKATIPVTALRDDEKGNLQVQLASYREFERAGIERNYYLTQFTFDVVETDGETVIHVSSKNVVKEPFIDFLITATTGNGRLIREYTVLLDPPKHIFDKAPKTSVTVESQVKPVVTKTAESVSQVNREAVANTSSSYGPTDRNDTLWKIAVKTKPTQASVHQMMMALLNENPSAFVNNNINGLKAGQTLAIPSVEGITSLSQSQAISAVAEQNLAWKNRNTAKQVAVTTVSNEKKVVSEQPAVSSNQLATETAESTARLKLVSPTESTNDNPDMSPLGDTKLTELTEQLTLAQETIENQTQENIDIKARMEAMEEQIETLRRLLSLKDPDLARLQDALEESNVETPASEILAEEGATGVETVQQNDTDQDNVGDDELATTSNANVDETVSVEPVVNNETALSSEPESEELTEAVINTDTDVSEAEPAEVQPVTTAPEIDAPIAYVANIAGLDAQEAQSKYDELKSWVSAHKMEVGIGGLLLLLIVWLIVRVKNRPYQNWDDAVSKDEPEKKGTETTRPSLVDNNDVIDTVEAKPPVAEPEKSIEQLINDADVYVSYGDFSKAKLALQEASRKAPENTSITHKLLFVLFKQSQVKEFVALATEYRNQSEATEWDEVLSWGQELAPNEELFQPQLKSNTASVAQSEVEQPAAIETINIDSDFGNEALNLDIEPNNNVEDIAVSNNGVERLDLPEMEPESLTSDNEEPVSELDNNVMEFDLNIDSESDDNFELDGLDTITDSDLSEATAALSETSQDNEFEFDLGDFDQVDESETKLDLAAAYIDMGDPEGAKSILEEVLLEGNDEQKSRAQTLMTELN